MTRRFLPLIGLACAGLLCACGGGDDDSTPPVTSEVPPSASASVAGLIRYLKALVVADADTLEPVDVSAVTLPTDDLNEPADIN